MSTIKTASHFLGSSTNRIFLQITGIYYAKEEIVIERGFHHKIVKVAPSAPSANADATSSATYTELQNGMHYLENGIWNESEARFDEIQGRLMASKGPITEGTAG